MADLRAAEACDLAASYAEDAREYGGGPSPRIAELRAIADQPEATQPGLSQKERAAIAWAKACVRAGRTSVYGHYSADAIDFLDGLLSAPARPLTVAEALSRPDVRDGTRWIEAGGAYDLLIRVGRDAWGDPDMQYQFRASPHLPWGPYRPDLKGLDAPCRLVPAEKAGGE